MTEQINIFSASLRIHFYSSKSTLDSLKSIFSASRRKPSLGAPEKIVRKQHRDMSLWNMCTLMAVYVHFNLFMTFTINSHTNSLKVVVSLGPL